MDAMSKNKFADQSEEQRTARMRMALFPKGAERFFVDKEVSTASASPSPLFAGC